MIHSFGIKSFGQERIFGRSNKSYKNDLPLALRSSGTTNSVRSGSSPYQKIHSSLAALSDNGGCMTYPFPVEP